MDERLRNKPDAELTWQEHIRKRPGMYLGRVDLKGFIDIISGIHCDIVEDSQMKNDFTVEVKSDKKGILSLSTKEGKVSELWNPNFNAFTHNTKNLYNLNLRVLSSLSSLLIIRYYDSQGNVISKETYNEGKLKSEPTEAKKANRIEIEFELDKRIWGDEFTISEFHLSHTLRELAFLKKGSKVRIKYQVDNKECIIIHPVSYTHLTLPTICSV